MKLIKSTSMYTISLILVHHFLYLILTVLTAERESAVFAFLGHYRSPKLWHWVLLVQRIRRTRLGGFVVRVG